MVIPWVGDTEIFPDCFVAVFRNINGVVRTFGFWQHIDDRKDLVAFLTDPDNVFVDYNGIQFDGVIWQAIINDPNINHAELLELRDSSIQSKWPLINKNKRDFTEYDLLKIWHFDNVARMTSLKQLEFFFRLRSIKDLPYHYNKNIQTQTAYDNVAKYCQYDLVPTDMLFKKSVTKIKARHEVIKKFGLDVRNLSDSSMGEMLILHLIAQRKGVMIEDLQKMGTDRDKIVIADIPLDIFKRRKGICHQVITQHFNKIVLHGMEDPKSKRRVFNFKGNQYEFQWRGIEVVIGFGGIHGCIDKGVYESDDDFIIKSDDVTSQYPNAVINFKIYPAHLGPDFVEVFDKDVYQERAKYPKKTHFTMNQTYKLACNAAVGKFNSQWSPLYDPLCNLQVTVNCQLAILALAEDILDNIPGAQLLMLNTDGLETRIPREYEDRYREICNEWCKLTQFQLESVDYQKMAIYNVNNYIAISTDGKVKRKGLFCTYEDLVNQESYHKDSSATIIPLALSNYFSQGTPIEDTILQCDDIHEFAFGVKKTKSFNYAVLIPHEDRSITIKKFTERFFRYYISNSPKSGNLVKIWFDGRITSINKGDLIMPAQSLRSPKASKYPDLNREWYINKAHEIRSEMEYS